MAALVLFLAVLPAVAGVGVWTPAGPDGGTVSALDFAPNGRTAYAGTLAGSLFKTVDRGRTWRASGAVRGRVRDLEVDPFQPTRVYAAASEGLWVSDDNGRTWERRPLPGVGEAVDALSVAADPVTAGVVWVTLAGPGQIYRSADHGLTWRHAGAGLLRTNTVALHPNAADIAVAATVDGVYRTANAGRSWTRGDLEGRVVVDLVFDLQQPSRLYAATIGTREQGGPYVALYVSEDLGRSWTRVGPEVTGVPPIHLVADPFAAGTAYVSVGLVSNQAVYRTRDAGRTWESVLEGESIHSLVAGPRHPGVLFAGRNATNALRPATPALLRSSDSGDSWSSSGEGIQSFYTEQVVADPLAPGVLYARNQNLFVWRSLDGGVTWTDIAPQGWNRVFIDLIVDPVTPGTLYLVGGAGVFKSLDRGTTWTLIHETPLFAFATLAIDPAAPGTLYAGLREHPRTLKSVDGGVTFQELPGAAGLYTTELATAPGSPSPVYANGREDWSAIGIFDRVRRSLDGGATWPTVLEIGFADAFVTDIVIDPRDARRVLVAFEDFDRDRTGSFQRAGGGVYRSSDGGATWALSRLPAGILSLAFDAGSPAVVYAGGAGGRAFVSGDGGATWTSIGAGLPYVDVAGLAADPHHPGTVFGALFGGGVYSFTRISTATASPSSGIPFRP